jgi:transcriptional regulator GlxA family with amidase domain
VVDDGDLVTAAGVTSGIDLALWLTERLAGPAVVEAVSTNLEYRRQGALRTATS